MELKECKCQFMIESGECILFLLDIKTKMICSI